MEFRRQLISAQVALAAVIVVTALMTVVALSMTTTRGGAAYHQVTRDQKLRDNVRRSADILADATRRYLIDGTDAQRSRIMELQRELDPNVDRLAARATDLGASNSDDLEHAIDDYIAWLSAVAAEHGSRDDFERALESRTMALEKQLKLFADAADDYGERTIARADRLARRARLGVVFTSGIAIVIAFVLGWTVLRRTTPLQPRDR